MAGPSVDLFVKAVDQILDPATDPASRQLAHQICDEFKSNTDVTVCIDTGYRLFTTESAADSVRFIGMQILQYCIQQRWQQLSDEIILQLRDRAIGLLQEMDIDTPSILKHGLSCFIVELIKKIWPQRWKDMVNDLYAAVKLNEASVETVTLVLERLSQDVIESGDAHLSQARRNELKQSLSQACTKGLFAFLTSKLLLHTTAEHLDNTLHVHLAHRILATMSAFLEWCPMKPVFANNFELLEVFCNLVGCEPLRLAAVECLIQLAERKSGGVSEREPLLVLFQQKPLEIFLKAVSASILETEQTTSVNLQSQQSYNFLKRLSTLLLRLGTHQVLQLWGTREKPGSGEPTNFGVYLDVLLEFLKHGSICLNAETALAVPLFLEHELVRESTALRERLPTLLSVCAKLIVKPQYDSSSVNPFMAMDFLDQTEFNRFAVNYRHHVLEVFRSLVSLMPMEIAELISGCVMTVSKSPEALGQGDADAVQLFHNQCSGIQALVDVFASALSKLPRDVWPNAALLVQPLESLLLWNCTDPVIAKAKITMIESLFVFLDLAPTLLPDIIRQILAAVESANAAIAQGNYEVFNALRLKAAASLIRLCFTHSELIHRMSLLTAIYDGVQAQWALSTYRLRQYYSEALVCASRALPSLAEQQAIVVQIVQPVADILESSEVQSAISSTAALAEYIGLDQSPAQLSEERKATLSKHRHELIFAFNCLSAVARRGEAVEVSGTLCSAAWPSVQRLLPHVFACIRTLNDFSSPGASSVICAEFKKAFELTMIGKAQVLGIDISVPEFMKRVREDSLSAMQHCVNKLYEGCFTVLGHCANRFGELFYTLPNLVEEVTASTFHSYTSLPAAYLKMSIRLCLVRLLMMCPSHHFDTVVTPLLTLLFNRMNERLNMEWVQMVQRQGDLPKESPEDGLEEQLERLCQDEVVEDHMARYMLKEYLWFVGKMLPADIDPSHRRGSQSADGATAAPGPAPGPPNGSVAMEEEDEEDKTPSMDNGRFLAKHIASTPALYEALLTTCLTGLVVPDALFSNRVCAFLLTLLPKLSTFWLPDVATYPKILEPIVQSLCTHGEHAGNVTTCVQLIYVIYPLMLQANEQATQLLLSRLPGATVDKVSALKEGFCNPATKDKKKRDLIRQLLSGVIGKSTSEKHQIAVPEAHLPRVPLVGSKSMAEAEVTHHVDHILALPDLGLTSLFS